MVYFKGFQFTHIEKTQFVIDQRMTTVLASGSCQLAERLGCGSKGHVKPGRGSRGRPP